MILISPLTLLSTQLNLSGDIAIVAFVCDTRTAGQRVLGYGAALSAVVLLNRAGVTPNCRPAKQRRRLPGTRTPVLPPDSLIVERPDRIRLVVSDGLEEVHQEWPEIERGGGRWVLLNPVPRLASIAEPGGN